MSGSRNRLDRVLEWLANALAAIGTAVQGLMLSLMILPVVLIGAVGLVGFAVWRWARPVFQGDRLLFTTYLSTLQANVALSAADASGGKPAAYWQSRLTDLADGRAFGAWEGMSEQRYSLAPLLAIEAEILVDTPEAAIGKRFWALEERFARMVPDAMVECWDREKEQIRAGKAENAPPVIIETRANAATLLARIHDTYLCNVSREKSVREMKVFIVFTAIAVSLIVAVMAGLLGQSGLFVPKHDGNEVFLNSQSLVLLFTMGMMGASVSVTRRMSNAVGSPMMAKDAMLELSGFAFGHAGIALGLVLGGIFALVIYFLFMAGGFDQTLGKLGGALLPTFREACAAPTCSAASEAAVDKVVTALFLTDRTQLAKLLIWCFLVGFSERLVPDMLDRLAKQAQSTTTK